MNRLFISYNKVKGTIPGEVSNLNLTHFHLHSNKLTGKAYLVQPESFVADCGNTILDKQLIECETCTHCCNQEGGCLAVTQNWI